MSSPQSFSDFCLKKGDFCREWNTLLVHPGILSNSAVLLFFAIHPFGQARSYNHSLNASCSTSNHSGFISNPERISLLSVDYTLNYPLNFGENFIHWQAFINHPLLNSVGLACHRHRIKSVQKSRFSSLKDFSQPALRAHPIL